MASFPIAQDASLKECLHCGREFALGHNAQKFCTDVCRFWAKVGWRRAGECWLWQGCKHHSGHGQFGVGPVARIYAHRFSWELVNGPVPDGQCVLHRCDVPACVNPDHLFLGTRVDNMHDMWAKGRGSKPPRLVGARHHQAKLTEADVAAIRRSPAPDRETAEAYGVKQRTIWAIRHRQTWKHVA